MKNPVSFVGALGALMALPVCVFCTQQSTQSKKPVPSMTSDDVVATRPVRTAEDARADQQKTSDQSNPEEASVKPSADEES